MQFPEHQETSASNPFVPFELASDRPPLPWWGNASVLVHIVVNVEVWPFDAPMPRKLLGSPHGRDHVPDVPNFAWAEYGIRCGLPRLLSGLERRRLPASASMNAAVVSAYPSAASAIHDAGWEVVAHGVTQQSLPSADDEHATIMASLEILEAFTGSRPRGWLGPGLAETNQTLGVLSQAGLDYVCDWVLDDEPVWIRSRPRPLVGVPYTLELNDSPLYAGQWHPAEEFERRVLATLDVYRDEADRGPEGSVPRAPPPPDRSPPSHRQPVAGHRPPGRGAGHRVRHGLGHL